MAKLYWRVKKNAKWTWVPAKLDTRNAEYVIVRNYDGGEE